MLYGLTDELLQGRQMQIGQALHIQARLAGRMGTEFRHQLGIPVESRHNDQGQILFPGGRRRYARTESVIGLFKTAVIQRLGPWRNLDTVAFQTLTSGRLVQRAPAARVRAVGGA